MKPWKEFELLIEKIQSEAAPDATVKHNQHKIGKSGSRRQLDITINRDVGLFPVLIVIECKRYKRPVSIDKVEAFVTKLKDVQASEGVMISVSGFDSGAISTAKQHGITLLTYREAEEADWNLITGSEAWIKIYVSNSEDVSAKALLRDSSETKLNNKSLLLDEEGNEFSKGKKVITKLINKSRSLKPIGEFEIEGAADQPLFIEKKSNLKEIEKFIINGRNTISEFVINLELSSGHVLENPGTDEAVYRQVISEPWDWNEILKTKPARRLTSEEFQELIQQKGASLLHADINKRYWRVVLTKKVE